MSNDTTQPPKTAATIAKFFGLKAKDALEAMKGLTQEDKGQLAEGIRNETLTY